MALPPGPRLPPLLQTLAWIRRPGPFLDECARRHGRRFTLRFVGGRTFLIVSDPADVQAVFRGPPEVFLSGQANQGFRPFLGEHSLFVLDGEAHRAHRRPLLGPFRGERMRAYGELIRDLSLQEVGRWPRGRAFPLEAAMHEVTLEVILRAIFGEREPGRLARARELVERMTGRAGAVLPFVGALRRDLGPWSPWGGFLAARARFHTLLVEAIREAHRAPQGREDILARLVAEEGALGTWGEEGLRDELMTLLGAGHETTTAALAWAFLRVLRTPGVLGRIREELGEGPFDPGRVASLRYLEAVVQETLRLHPPIPIALRWLAAPAALDGLEVPAGTHVCPSPWLTHRDPRVHPDPLRFRPERFLGPRPTASAFYPFGGGGRLCVGAPFAVYEMQVILATVLARVDLRLAGTPTLRARRKGIITTPVHGTPVVVSPRGAGS
ncbi:MAG: cytochrome P450 [Planctomycetes bacterium]|nr:cytochrome P450 [Planctomycetota bacterium]